MSGETTFRLPDGLETAVRAELEEWRTGDKVKRLWSRDATPWTGADEASWLGWPYSFGVVKAAQALGDFQVLRERGRRALRVHLGADVKSGLARLRQGRRGVKRAPGHGRASLPTSGAVRENRRIACKSGW